MNILFDTLIMTNYFLAFKDLKKQKTEAVSQKAAAYREHKSTNKIVDILCRIPDLKEKSGCRKDYGKQSGSRQMGGADKQGIE